MASSNPPDNPNEDHLLNHVTDQWNELNKTLEHVPKFQNKDQTGVSEERIRELETKLKITLPKEIRAVIKVHDGRKHIGYGLGYRLPTTDLLPIAQWRPYEKDDYDCAEDLFRSLADKNDKCADNHLREDAREHLNAYIEGSEKAQKQNNDNKLINNEAFQSLPCELLIIGQGMDDYVEQYLLSIRSGKIYLAIHNIPEWRLIGTFADWVQKGLINAKEQSEDLKEQHEDVEVI
jgi:hypothetical protein